MASTRDPLTHDQNIDDDDDNALDHYNQYPHASTNAGVYGAVFNLSTSIIGAGIMALPATMKVLGLVFGIVVIILLGVLSEISVEMLVRFTAQCKATSYGEVVQQALGSPAKILAEICIILNNAGCLVVYLIIMGDVMSGSARHAGVFDQLFGNYGIWDDRRLLMFVVLVVFLAPLCALNKIESLSTTSAVSVVLAILFVIIACVAAVIMSIEGEIAPPRLIPDFGSGRAILDLFVVVPIILNAYVCHYNIQPIYNELKGRSPKKMTKVGRITTVICVITYVLTAVSGYLLFGKYTEDDVLMNFDKHLAIRYSTTLSYIVRVGYIFHLILVFPVIHFSLRQTVDALAFSGRAPLTESKKRCLGLTCVILGIIYLASILIPNIWTAFKFTGATTAVSLGFTFPAIIALRLGRKGSPGLSDGERLLSWLMLILAVTISIVGVLGNI